MGLPQSLRDPPELQEMAGARLRTSGVKAGRVLPQLPRQTKEDRDSLTP